jgi:FkbH-like protein
VNKADLKSSIDQCLQSGSYAAARALLCELWHKEPTAITAAFVLSRRQCLKETSGLKPVRVRILRSFTVEPVIPIFRAAAAIHGLDLTVDIGGFNTCAQEILGTDSELYASNPDVVFLAMQTRDVAPELWDGIADLDAGARTASIDRVSSWFRNLIETFRQNSHAHLVVHMLEGPVFRSEGILDVQAADSQSTAIRRINQSLRRCAEEHQGVYVLDHEAMVAECGKSQWFDERKWLTARLPFSSQALGYLAAEWLRYVQALSGQLCKVLVTDLDNTLWGGVLGEDGFDGIKIDAEYPGGIYRALQRTLLDLSRRGILLAVSSKNNADDAMRVLNEHPGMLLRPEHFAAMRINWNDKAQSLREIAAELNLGIDSLAFLDDNPAERHRVRTELPMVTVLELPEDPAGYASCLRASPVFERLSVTDEDRQRSTYYVQQRQQRELEQNVGSLEDFYRALDQRIEILPFGPNNLGRLAQLTQKTNQFNLTTRRYSEQQLLALAEAPGSSIYGIRAEDRFGDAGIVGLAILKQLDETAEIDTLLLSCRVIGRTIETALLSFLVNEGRAAGARKIQGWFLPTKKNAPAASFYSKHAFTCIEDNGSGSLWSLDIECSQVPCPEWISVVRPEGCLAQ